MFRIDEALNNGDNLYKINEQTQRMEFSYKDEILESYNQLFSNLFPNINLDPSTPQGQIITSLVQQDLGTVSFCENMLNSFFLGGTGQYLDLWAWNVFRVVRKKGTPSLVNITITGVPNTPISQGYLITDGIYEYKLREDVVIGLNGSISAPFECTEINTFIASPNTINTFVSVVVGVETINNPNQSIPAILPETDSELFLRCLTFGATATNSSFRSILSNVAQTKGVLKLTGAENKTNEIKVFKGVTLTDHSICVCVLGASDEDIANAIFNSEAPGCSMIGDVEVPILLEGTTYTYKFYRPIEIPIKVKVEVSIDLNSPTNWETVVKDNVIAFVDGANIADLITQPNLSKHLFRNVTGFDIVDVKMSKLSDVLGYDSIALKLNEMIVITRADIEVVQV